TLAPLTEQYPDITINDAYAISQHLLHKRMSRDNERIVGKKIGVTSKAVQDMLGVYQPDFGFLTDAMQRANGAKIEMQRNLIQPKAEGEIAFHLKENLTGPGVTESDVLAATATIVPCFEIVDSRIADWNIQIQDTIADNASCGLFILGDAAVDPRGLDLPGLKLTVFKNGEVEAEGFGSAVQGNPLTAVAWLANTLGDYGIALKAGEVILSGSLTPFIPVAPGDELHLELAGVGAASCRFV
ncbi:MAG: 2-oxopent-4-enoate hydratase, partial [Gammaproteobacteria bacterium]|nr:2-oxopent-4-enoate hydratase [Gammaproteobacteria bacterium]